MRKIEAHYTQIKFQQNKQHVGSICCAVHAHFQLLHFWRKQKEIEN